MKIDVRGQIAWNPGSSWGAGHPAPNQENPNALGPDLVPDDRSRTIGGGVKQTGGTVSPGVPIPGGTTHSCPTSVSSGPGETPSSFPP